MKQCPKGRKKKRLEADALRPRAKSRSRSSKDSMPKQQQNNALRAATERTQGRSLKDPSKEPGAEALRTQVAKMAAEECPSDYDKEGQ